MPVIPKGNYSGRVSESVGTPSNIGFGAGAVEEALGRVGGQVAGVASDLLEKRTKALASDFAVRQGLQLDRDLRNLKLKLQQELPDGKGFSEAFEKEAKALHAKSFKGAPSNFAEDFYKSYSDNILNSAIVQADGFEHVARAEAATRLIQDQNQETRNFLLSNPDEQHALNKIMALETEIFSKEDLYGHLTPDQRNKLNKGQGSTTASDLVEGLLVKDQIGRAEAALSEKSAFNKYFDPDDKSRLLFKLEAKKKQKKEERSGELSLIFNDTIKGLVTSKSVDPSHVVNVHKMIDQSDKPPYVKERMHDELTIATDVNSLLDVAHTKPASSFNDLAANLVSRWSSPSLKNEINRDQALDAFAIGVKAINDERAKFPREYNIKNNTEVAALYNQWQSLPPGPEADQAREQYFIKSDAAGKALEMGNMRATTKEESKLFSSTLQAAANPEMKAQVINGIKAKYGPYANKAIYEMTVDQSELDTRYAVVGALTDPTSAINAIEGAKAARDSELHVTKRPEIAALVKDELKDFRVAMGGRDRTGKGSVFATAVSDIITDAALLRMSRGEGQTDAIENAVEDIFNKNFTKVKSNADSKSVVYVPANIGANIVNIQAFMDSHRGVEYLKSLDIYRGQNDQSDDFFTGPTGLVNKVRWTTNVDGTGLVLVYDDDIQGPINVPRKDGSSIEFSFKDLAVTTDDLTREAKSSSIKRFLKSMSFQTTAKPPSTKKEAKK